jgi:hypothetical protein
MLPLSDIDEIPASTDPSVSIRLSGYLQDARRMAYNRNDHLLRVGHVLYSVLDYVPFRYGLGDVHYPRLYENTIQHLPTLPLSPPVVPVYDPDLRWVMDYAQSLMQPRNRCISVWHVALSLLECPYSYKDIFFESHDPLQLATKLRWYWGVGTPNKVRVLTRRRDSHGG